MGLDTPGCGPGHLPGVGLDTPQGVGLNPTPARPPQPPPWVLGLDTHSQPDPLTSPLGVGLDTPSPVNRMTDRQV